MSDESRSPIAANGDDSLGPDWIAQELSRASTAVVKAAVARMVEAAKQHDPSAMERVCEEAKRQISEEIREISEIALEMVERRMREKLLGPSWDSSLRDAESPVKGGDEIRLHIPDHLRPKEPAARPQDWSAAWKRLRDTHLR